VYFSFSLFQTSSVFILILNQSSIGQSNGFSHFRSIFFFLLHYLFALYFFPLCLHFLLAFVFLFNFSFPLSSSFDFHFPFPLPFPFPSKYLLNNDNFFSFHSSEGSSSHKKISFPLFSFYLFHSLFSFNYFRFLVSFVSSFSSTGIDIQFGLLTSWMFSSILNITLRFDSRYYQVVFVSWHHQAFWFFFLSCDLWGPVCCLSVLYISRVCSYEYELIILLADF